MILIIGLRIVALKSRILRGSESKSIQRDSSLKRGFLKLAPEGHFVDS